MYFSCFNISLSTDIQTDNAIAKPLLHMRARGNYVPFCTSRFLRSLLEKDHVVAAYQVCTWSIKK